MNVQRASWPEALRQAPEILASRPLALAPGRRDVGPVLPVEIGFLASFGVDRAALIAAVEAARAQGISVDVALLASGAVEESFFYRALAIHLGVAYLDGDIVLGSGTRYPAAILTGVAPLAGDHRQSWLVAPRGDTLVMLMRKARTGGLPPLSLAITTPSHLSRRVLACASATIAWDASNALSARDASLSARVGPTRAQVCSGLGAAFVGTLSYASAPELSATCLFLPAILLRLFSAAASFEEGRPAPRRAVADHRLPTYSIVVALHREARVAAHLATALDAIDYPCGKLDIKLVLEADDLATRQALEALALAPVYEIVIAPPGFPRTKPRALNVALPLLRGEFVAIFDAEDVPAPRQLREAAERFLHAPRRLACLQASLAIDNIDDSWLTKLFAIEYATLFDVLHQGTAGLRLPLPLGGSSNHFRTDVLREVGGWDAWNVTEDADLGMRLARCGYRTSTLASSTHEEAPARLTAWLTQRRRWSKGWMQTFITLSRDPLRLLRDVGLRQTAVIVMMMTALVVVPPLWPILAGLTLYDLARHGLPAPTTSYAVIDATLWTSVAVFGSGSMVWLALVGMKRRDLLGLWPYLPLLLPYQFLMSVAAWAALFDLFLRPFHWHKTEHGLARSSRRNGGSFAAPTTETRSESAVTAEVPG
jgi:cellulose synthase/poly-beta-1,6-N-acetylglucosamine synthase-like glycosyltransferase